MKRKRTVSPTNIGPNMVDDRYERVQKIADKRLRFIKKGSLRIYNVEYVFIKSYLVEV